MWYLRHHARKFFRAYMKPIPVEKARLWYNRTRYLYVLSGFTAFVFSFSIYYQHKDEISKMNPYLDKSTIHKAMRQKGEPGEVIIAKIGWNQPVQIERYNNEDYIKEYNEIKRKYDLEKQQKATESDNKNNLNQNLM